MLFMEVILLILLTRKFSPPRGRPSTASVPMRQRLWWEPSQNACMTISSQFTRWRRVFLKKCFFSAGDSPARGDSGNGVGFPQASQNQKLIHFSCSMSFPPKLWILGFPWIGISGFVFIHISYLSSHHNVNMANMNENKYWNENYGNLTIQSFWGRGHATGKMR